MQSCHFGYFINQHRQQTKKVNKLVTMVTLLMGRVPSAWDAVSFSIARVAFIGVFSRVPSAPLEDPVFKLVSEGPRT